VVLLRAYLLRNKIEKVSTKGRISRY